MLFKLSMTGIKSKSKDYLILLVGLVMSISIFYMFQTLGLNKGFLKENTSLGAILFVFQAGSYLLGIITFFYIIYANSFLFSLRQKEFGMYMMLGAKKNKITLLMFIETIIIGIVSLIVGSIVGIGLAYSIGQLLMKQLDFTAIGYAAFYIPALKATFSFFLKLFVLAAIINSIKLSRISILQLVHKDSKTDHISVKGIKTVIIAFLAMILLACGYTSMIYMDKLMHFGIIIALITVTMGTYMLFGAFLPLVIKKLKNNKKYNEKGLNSFTIAQLNYRINSLTRILATITMLVALGAGAISGGMAFQNNVMLKVDSFYYYDVVIHNPTVEEKKILDSITFTEKNQYRYKEDDKFVYYLKEDLDKNPPIVNTDSEHTGKLKRISEKVPLNTVFGENVKEEVNENEVSHIWKDGFRTIVPGYVHLDHTIKVVDHKMYNNLSAKEGVAFIGKSDNYVDYKKEWKTIDELQLVKYKDLIKELEPKFNNVKDLFLEQTKYHYYNLYSGFVSGILFMAFFLGFAFLTMMASCLMFKILSGASSDIMRYKMLRKIGVRRELLTKSIYKELFFVFLFPAIVGIAHVLFGMNIFAYFLINPYYHIWIPIMIFLFIYVIYYFITVQLYREIVLPKKE